MNRTTPMSVRVFVGRWVDGVVSDEGENAHGGYTGTYTIEGRALEYVGGDLWDDDINFDSPVYYGIVVYFPNLDTTKQIISRRVVQDLLKTLSAAAESLDERAAIGLWRAHKELRFHGTTRVYDFTIAVHQIWAFSGVIVDGDHAIKSRVFKLL